jgi:hypothetical protein
VIRADLLARRELAARLTPIADSIAEPHVADLARAFLALLESRCCLAWATAALELLARSDGHVTEELAH